MAKCKAVQGSIVHLKKSPLQLCGSAQRAKDLPNSIGYVGDLMRRFEQKNPDCDFLPMRQGGADYSLLAENSKGLHLNHDMRRECHQPLFS
jgi:hypothetical protein